MNQLVKLINSKTTHSSSRKMRTVSRLAIVTLAFSFASLIIASAVIRGFKSEIFSKIFDFWGHIHVTSADMIQSFESEPITLDSAFMQKIKAEKSFALELVNENNEIKIGDEYQVNVEAVVPFITLPIMLESRNGFEGMFLKSVGEDHEFFKSQEKYLLEGNMVQGENDVIISNTTAKRLEVKVGDSLKAHWIKNGKQKTARLEISGIYKSGLQEYDRAFAFAQMPKLQGLQSWSENKISGYEISLSNPELAELYNHHIFYEHLPMDWFSTSVDQKFRNIFQWVKWQSQNEKIMFILLGIVVLINLATLLLIMIVNRLKMIGILKSLGISEWDLRTIFLVSGYNILIKALVLGNVLGVGLCLLQKHFKFIKLSEEDYYLSAAPIELNYTYLLVFNVIALIVTSIFMLLPTFFITRLDPVRILRID